MEVLEERSGGNAAALIVTEARHVLGASRSPSYRAVAARRAGDSDAWPTPLIMIGSHTRISTAMLLAVLGVEPAT